MRCKTAAREQAEAIFCFLVAVEEKSGCESLHQAARLQWHNHGVGVGEHGVHCNGNWMLESVERVEHFESNDEDVA